MTRHSRKLSDARSRKEAEMSSGDNNSKGAGAGVSFFGLLTICFIVLKILGKIDWSWTWVLSPIWIPLAVGLMLIIFAVTFLNRR